MSASASLGIRADDLGHRFDAVAIVQLVDEIREHQGAGGAIGAGYPATQRLPALVDVVRRAFLELDRPDLAAAFASDVHTWIARGVETSPRFDATVTRFVAPRDGEQFLLVAPIRTPNGDGVDDFRFEAIFGFRADSADWSMLARRYPCLDMSVQSVQSICASRGLRSGNCIAIFPENIATTVQCLTPFALCFQDKYFDIFHSITLPLVAERWPTFDVAAARIDRGEFYRVASIRSYFHDYFHHSGPRPLLRHLELKRTWHVGLLEELRVDCSAVVTAWRDNLPRARETAEFVLLERLFRYPGQGFADTSSDAASGAFLSRWFAAPPNPALTERGLDLSLAIERADALVRAIAAVELVVDDTEYARCCTDFVDRVLSAPAPAAWARPQSR